eukprot:s784_g13.t1
MSSRACRLRVLGRLRISVGATRLRCSANFSRSFSKVEPDLRSATSLPSVEAWTQAEIVGEWHYDSGMSYFVEPDAHGHLHFNEWDRPLVCTRAKSKKFLLNRGIHHHGSLAPDEDGWFSGQLLNQDGSHIGDLRMKYDQPQGVMITQCRPPLSDWGNVTRARRDKELATTGSFTQYAVLGTLLFAGAMLLQELNWRNSLRALFAVAGMESYSDELEQMVKDVWAAKPKEPSAAESELDWLDFTHDMGGYKDRISREQPFKVRGNRSGAVHGRSDGHQADGNGGTPAARLSSAEQQDLQEFLEVLQESLKGDDLPVAVRKCGASDEKHQVWQEPNLRQAWSIGDEQGASFGEGEDLAENLWPLLARLSSKDRDALLSKMADLQRQVQAGDVNSRKKLEELCRHLGLERPGGLDGESGHLNPQDLAAAMAAAQKRMACLEAADGGSTQWSNLSVQSTALQQLLKGCEESSWRLSQGLLQVADGDATANALLSALGNEPSTTAHLSAALQRLATLDDQLQQQRAALGARGRRRNGGLEDEVLSQFLQEKSDALSVLKDTAKDLLDENSRSQVYDAWQSQLTSALEHVVATGITGAEEDGSPSQRIPGSPSSPTAAMEEARQRLAALEAARAARHRRPRFKAGSTFAEHDPSWWQKLPTEESLGDNRQGLQERLRRHHEMLQQWRLEVGEQAEQDLPMLAAELAMHERLLSNMLENGGLQELIEADEELEDLLRACRDGAQILSLEILEASTSDPTTAALLALRSATSADGLGETRSETLDAALSRLAAWAEGLEEQREAMRCGAPLDGALLATLAAERADLLKWMEDQGNSGCDGLQQLRALLAERSSELEMMAGTQRSAVSAAEAGGAAAEDLSEQGERDPDGTKKKTFGDDDLLSELEEANRRLARFDAELEKQRKGLQRRRRKKGQEAFVDPEVLASLVQERAALVDWAEDRLQKSEDPSLVAFRQQCRDAARRLEQLVMEDLQGAERFAAGSVDPTALLAEARRRLLMLEEEGNQRLRRRQRVLPGAEEAIGEDPEDPFGTKKTRFDDHDWQSNLEEARRRLRRFEEQLEEQRSGLRRRRKNGEDASLPEEVLASLVSERAELVEWAEDQLKTSGGAPSLVAFREQCRDAARRLEQLVVEDLDGAGSKAAVDPSALLAEARRRLILMEEEAAKQRLKRRQRGEHAAATPGRGTASSRPKVVRDEDPEVLMADAARRLARLEEELESQRQGLCRRRLQPKTEAPEVQAAHALMHESAIEELKDQRDGCRAECDRLLRAAMANDTMWSPEQRATCNELQEKCLELEEAWNSCADTAEQLKEEVAEAAMPSRLTALLRSKDSHQAEASEALLEAMRRVASFDHELEQQRNLMKRRRKAAVDTSAEDAILTALLEEKRQAMAECEEMAPKDEAWEDLHLLWQGPLTTSLVELAADTPAKGAKVQRGSVNAAEKNQALAEAQRRLEMLDEESQRQRLGLQRRRKVAEQAGRQELEKLVEGGTEFEHLAAEHREGLNHQQNNIKEVMASDLEPLEEIESWRQMVGLEELQAAAGKMSEQLATIEEAEGEEMAVESPEKRQKRRLDGPVGVSVEDRSAAKHQCEEMQVRLQEMRQDEEERQRLLMQRRQRKVKEPPEHAEKAAQMTEENSRDLLLKAHATRPYTAQLFRSEFAAFLFRAMALLPWLLCISWTVPSRGTGSCKEIGCGGHDETCWCVASCWSFNDCCHDYAAVCPEKPPSVQLSEVNFLVTTDLHSWIEGRRHQPHLDASLAHVASVLEHLRQSARSAQRDVFFFDNGDINDGTGLSASAEDHVEYLVPVLRSAKYDALNVGNHELYQRNGYGMLPGAACPIVGLKESGYIDSWKGRYLTSNVVWAKSQQPIGERYAVIEGEFGTKLLVFGFLYNMRDHCDAVQVLKVEDVVNSTWFQDAVDGHAAQVDAVVVLAHMDYRDGLVDLLWRSLRSRVGETKPIQVFAGHSHIRGYRQLDNFSSVYEAGCKLDTVGFLSFQHRADGSGLDFDHANITGNVHDMAGAATGVFSGMKDH